MTIMPLCSRAGCDVKNILLTAAFVSAMQSLVKRMLKAGLTLEEIRTYTEAVIDNAGAK